MSLALIALLCAATLWMLAMRQPWMLLRTSARRIEFWWVLSAFCAGLTFPAMNIASIGSLGSSDVDTALRLAPMLIIGSAATIRSLLTGARIPTSGPWLLLAFGVLAAQSIQTPSPIALLSFLVFLPAIIAPKHGYDLRAIMDGCRVGVALGLTSVVGIALTNAPSMIGACRLDKCTLWGEALGPYGTGNALGLVIAASAAVSLLTASSARRFIIILASSYLLVDLSSSRSALYSWIVAVVITLAYQWSQRKQRAVVVVAGTIVAGIVVSSFTFLGWTGLDFTERGALWLYAQELIEGQPWFGYGSSFWVRGGGTDGIQLNYSTHNLVLELLVSFGVVGIAAFTVAIVAACRGRGQFEPRLFTTALVGIFCVMSITEVFSAPGRPYIMASFVVLIFIAGESVRSRPERTPNARRTPGAGAALYGAGRVAR